MLLNPTYPEKFRKPVEKRCRDSNVNLVLGEYVDEFPQEGSIGLQTRSGKKIDDADLVVCINSFPYFFPQVRRY